MEHLLCKYIKYKFIFNKDIKTTSYTYQKVFRSIYGYYQIICKKNSKKHTYYRKGILSDIPYIKSNKNSVIIPNGFENKLIDYFNTGENPTHNWKMKGDWKIDYNINNISLDLKNIAISIEPFIKNYKILSNDNNKNYNYLEFELNKIVDNKIFNTNYNYYLIKKLKYLFDFEWVYKSINYSKYIEDIYNKYLLLKEKNSIQL
jgi:hypothetical protein